MVILLFIIPVKENLEQREMTTESNEKEQRWRHERDVEQTTGRPKYETKWRDGCYPTDWIRVIGFLAGPSGIRAGWVLETKSRLGAE